MLSIEINPAAIKFDDDTAVEDIDLAEDEIIVDGERLTDERADAIAEDVLLKVRARNSILAPKDFGIDPADDIDLDQEFVLRNGERMTHAVAEQMAADAEKRSRAANLIPGGKSLSGDGSHSPVVQARVPEEVRARLNAIAERRGVRPSRLLREAIDQFIEREEQAG